MWKRKIFFSFLFFKDLEKMKAILTVFFGVVFLWTGHSSGWMVDYATG
jgi:hypothetical protein